MNARRCNLLYHANSPHAPIEEREVLSLTPVPSVPKETIVRRDRRAEPIGRKPCVEIREHVLAETVSHQV